MDFWNWLSCLVRIRIVGADVSDSLSTVSCAGFTVFNGEITDELTANITVQRTVYKKIQQILILKGNQVEIIDRMGLYWRIIQFLKRPVLLIGMIFLLFLNAYLPTRIFFVQVEGNANIPSREIIDASADCGLGFGTLRREIRSEQIKNKLLEAIPQLQWCGVNTSGTVAVISVRERANTLESGADRHVSSIVASRDGVIYQCTATRGNLVCKAGQAVKAGEVLISGYTDCGLKIQATDAEGEIYARTERTLSVVFPATWQSKVMKKNQIRKYSLIIGKNRINLYNDSGISYQRCGKMYKQTYVTLPGGFALPISIVSETWSICDFNDIVVEPDVAKETLSMYADSYLLKEMVAGKILATDESFSNSGTVYQIIGDYACLEMIGQTRKEEIYGKYD